LNSEAESTHFAATQSLDEMQAGKHPWQLRIEARLKVSHSVSFTRCFVKLRP